MQSVLPQVDKGQPQQADLISWLSSPFAFFRSDKVMQASFMKQGSTFKVESGRVRVWGAKEIVPAGQARVAPLMQRGNYVGRQVGAVRL